MKTATKPAPAGIADLRPRFEHRRNCWSCALSGLRANTCGALTLEEDADRPVLDWLQAAPMADDGTVPRASDGCPKWGGAR